ncbi:M61 family metallopeptidase [Granulosicoccus sp. 3-233]|uniref:M61 family metallopeptidase n=1 Tax=Granulosicoccus sp. 3-233 TaxID=3417969 RepID=UPI003D32B757
MITYRVSISDAVAHLIDVQLELDTPDPAGQQLTLPNWIPGSYMIRDFSRNIVQIDASSMGKDIVLTKQDKSSWQAPAGLTQLTVRYRVYAWDLSVRAAHVDSTHAFFNGTSVFLAVKGQEEAPHEVDFERPVHDTRKSFELATSLPAANTDETGFGRYVAGNYDELIDHPVELGTFKRLRFEAGGVPHEIIFTGACHFDEQRVVDDLQRICEYEIEFFGQPAPMDRYLFLVMVVDAGYGGLEHRSSTALMITRENLPVVGDAEISDAYLNFLGLCSHEYFHTWNVKRIKPARFIPFELREESYTELLWFFEGMTSYYDDLILVRAGLIDRKKYLTVLAKTLTRVQRGAGRLVQSVTESSFDAWHKFYKQDENSPNAIVSYYAKGALVALCLDALLRESSDDQQTLDTLMRLMWSRWQETGRGLEEDEPQRLAASLVETDLSQFFDRALYSTQELPVEKALSFMGVCLQWRSRTSSTDAGGVSESSEESADPVPPVAPWLGATVTDAPGGVRLVQVMKGGPAERAGLAGGDLLIAMNNLSVSVADVDRHLARHADLAEFDIHFFRLGQLHRSVLPVEPPPEDTADLRIVDGARLDSWLKDARLSV